MESFTWENQTNHYHHLALHKNSAYIRCIETSYECHVTQPSVLSSHSTTVLGSYHLFTHNNSLIIHNLDWEIIMITICFMLSLYSRHTAHIGCMTTPIQLLIKGYHVSLGIKLLTIINCCTYEFCLNVDYAIY